MKTSPRIIKVLKIVGPLTLSAVLVWWLFRRVDFQRVGAVIRDDTHFMWLIAVMGIVTLSHVIRGIRWGYQLRGAGVGNVPKMALCCSIFGAYAMNLIIPYMGEAWRIVYIAKRQKAPLSTVLGTDIGDRISDAIVVILLLILALAVGHDYIEAFLDHYSVGRKILHIVTSPALWLSVAGVAGAGVLLLYLLRERPFATRFFLSVKRTWHGFAILFTMKGRWQYLFLTIGIWTCYYLETYIGFIAFPFTRHLMEQPGMVWGLLPGLISFVFSSMSMLIPSNGGLGPWNIAVIFGLTLFGISAPDATAFSIVLWSTVSLTLVILGLFTVGYVSFSRRYKL
jgi:glycosyltransferase 2 family protein